MSINANNAALNEILEAINELPEAGGGTEEIEQIIDESEVLDGTYETVEDKVGALIDKTKNPKKPYIDTSKMTNFAWFFWKDTNFELLPEIDTRNGTIFNRMFSTCHKLVDASVIQIDTSNGTTFEYMFSDCKNMEVAPQLNVSKGTNLTSMFWGCLWLKTVPQLDLSSATNLNYIFVNCNSLTNIEFVPETIKISITIPSPVLSDESIKSILRGLAYVETPQTLKFDSVLYDKLITTDDDELYELYDNAVVEKGWNIAY